MTLWGKSETIPAERGSLLDMLGDAPATVPAKPRPSLLNLLSERPQAEPERDPEPGVAPIAEQVAEATSEPFDRNAALDRLDRLEAALREARRPDVAPVEPEPSAAEEQPVAVPAPAAAPMQTGDDLYGSAAPVTPVRAHSSARPPAVDLLGLIRTLLRNWYWLMAAGFLGGLLAFGYAKTLPNEYRSLARILIEPRGLRVLDNTVAPRGLNSEGTIAYLQSQVDIIRSSSVLDQVIEAEGLLDDPEFVGEDGFVTKLLARWGLGALAAPKETDPSGTVMREVQEKLYAGRLNQTFVIEIGMAADDPAKTARLTNAIARTYIRAEAGAQSDAARNANEDLTSRLGELRRNVEASERAVNEHKAKFGLVEANGRLVDEDQLARLNDRLAAAVGQTAEAKAIVDLARDVDVNDVIGGGLPADLASPSIAQLRLEYSRLRNRRDRLAAKLGSRHPERIAARAELSSARSAIRDEIRRLVASAERSFERATAREADLRESVEELSASTLGTSNAKSQLRELERNLDADRRVYEAFLQRSRETGEETNINQTSARIITEATPPLEKEGPNRKLIAIIGAVIGGSLAALLLLLPSLWQAGTKVLREDDGADDAMEHEQVHRAPAAPLPRAVASTSMPVETPAPAVAAPLADELPKRRRRRRRKSLKSPPIAPEALDAERREEEREREDQRNLAALEAATAATRREVEPAIAPASDASAELRELLAAERASMENERLSWQRRLDEVTAQQQAAFEQSRQDEKARLDRIAAEHAAAAERHARQLAQAAQVPPVQPQPIASPPVAYAHPPMPGYAPAPWPHYPAPPPQPVWPAAWPQPPKTEG